MTPVRTRSLKFQLGATYLMVGLAPALLFGVVALSTALPTVREGVEARNRALAAGVAGEVERFLDNHVIHLREVALAATLHPERAVDPSHLLQHLATNPALRSIALLDSSDRVVASAPETPGLAGSDFSGVPWVREARARGAPTWSAAAVSTETGQPAVTLVLPGRRHTLVGYLDLEELSRIVGRLGVGRVTVAAVVDRDGVIIAHRDARLLRHRLTGEDLPLVTGARGATERTGLLRLEGSDWLGSAVAIPATGWVALAMEPASTAFASTERLRLLLFATFAGTIVLALGVAWLSTRRILRPVEALAASTRRLAEGAAPAPRAKGLLAIEELEELERLFDAMSAAVRARERELARSERSYRRIADTPAVGVVRVAMDGTILYANDAMARLAGAPSGEALKGRSILPFYADAKERAALLREVATGGRVTNHELRARTFGGEERIVLLNMVRDEDGVTSVVIDVTESRRAAREKERLEQQLVHGQKLEAVGRLAGGIAHDFNNMLTAIIGFANVLREDLPAGHAGREAVEGILAAADRAANLTRSLLAYGRKQQLARRPVDLRAVVRDAARLIGRVLGEDVKLALELPDVPLTVLADPGQIDQVLMNLCANARDAMPKGGVLSISAEPISLDEAQAKPRGLAVGRWVRLRTVDTGVGIPRELVGRAFEPFFTTKPTGKGTGLGLAIVHGIVLQHEGAVELESEPGSGTTVTVWLPMLADAAPAVDPSGGSLADAPRGTETILLAEDEPHFRHVVRRILERGGYQVIEAADGRAAVAAWTEHRERIALSILDVVMPEQGGPEALAEIRRLDPAARALFTSGYAEDVLGPAAPGSDRPEVIPKPVRPIDLLRKVRETLDRRQLPEPAPRGAPRRSGA